MFFLKLEADGIAMLFKNTHSQACDKCKSLLCACIVNSVFLSFSLVQFLAEPGSRASLMSLQLRKMSVSSPHGNEQQQIS